MKVLKSIFILFVIICIQVNGVFAQNTSSDNYQGIKIYDKNPWYWQYKGKPVVLRGGSDDDNPYQWVGAKLTEHLDLIALVGGNYIRNSMSDRDEGNVFAFKEIRENMYDLTKWNDEYWNRLNFFLEETSKRDIIVQLTLWDHFDISSGSRWSKHPWNPDRNVNMKSGSWKSKSDFYSTIDRNAENEIAFQTSFIDKLLSVTLKYDNVIYNINNESSESEAWENFWAGYVKKSAKKMSKEAFVTNMQLSAFNAIRHVMTKGDIFDYVDISQVNQDSKGARGPAHWDYLMFLRQKIA